MIITSRLVGIVIVGLFLLSGCQEKSKQSLVAYEDKGTTTNTPKTVASFTPYTIDSTQIKTTPSGLKYYIVSEGSGNFPKKGEKVIVNYHGMLLDGAIFDSSFQRGQPFEFEIGSGQVIKGWDEGIPLCKVGGKIVLIISPDLGYGSQNMGAIPPQSTLVFDVEVLGTYN